MYKRRCVYVHRLSWELHFGKVPDGLLVCHKCDVGACMNPFHLFIGTNYDNMRDRHEKGRYFGKWCTSKDRLTDEEVLAIRAIRGMSARAIAELYGVAHSCIVRIRNRKSFVWLP